MADQETFLIALSERLWPVANEGFQDLSPSEQTFMLVWELEAEVNNGGFHQFFFNSAGDRAAQTAAALRQIGAEHTASIVEHAIALFPGAPPSDRAARQAILESIDPDVEAFDELDQEFYKYRDNLSVLLYEFALRHRADVRGA